MMVGKILYLVNIQYNFITPLVIHRRCFCNEKFKPSSISFVHLACDVIGFYFMFYN